MDDFSDIIRRIHTNSGLCHYEGAVIMYEILKAFLITVSLSLLIVCITMFDVLFKIFLGFAAFIMLFGLVYLIFNDEAGID